jgi:hypothetical protein
MIVYALAQAFQISPIEVYKMPAHLVMDMLAIHGEVEKYKSELIDKETKKVR